MTNIGYVSMINSAELMDRLNAAARGGLVVQSQEKLAPLVLEYRKAPAAPDIPCGPPERTYTPTRPGKHTRRRR